MFLMEGFRERPQVLVNVSSVSNGEGVWVRTDLVRAPNISNGSCLGEIQVRQGHQKFQTEKFLGENKIIIVKEPNIFVS
jgi:hypothetical protein